MNILDLLHGDFKPSGRDQVSGPCPWCGGDDRFVVTPEGGNHGKGLYWCRKCNASGDVIRLLEETRDMSYPEACEALNIEAGEMPDKMRRHVARRIDPGPTARDLCREIVRLKRTMTPTQKIRWQVYGMTNPGASEDDRDRARRLTRGVENEVINRTNDQ